MKTLGQYIFSETPDDQDIYYVNLHRQASFFITRDKTIIHGSRYYMNDTCDPPAFTIQNESILNEITNEDLENAIYIGENIISICKWFVTYGHFMDEAFALCDFQHQFPNITPRVLLDYHTDNKIITNYPVYPNYVVIDNTLFDNTSINAYSYGHRIIKMKKLYLIRHNITDPTFHAFPPYPRNKILSKNLQYTMAIQRQSRLFITRSRAIHMNRNLDNELEIEQYLHANKYAILNSESVLFGNFINNLHKATHIVMTWGGALTNMCYCSPNTQIIILKSKSYEHENLLLFDKIIKTYKLNVRVVIHTNNCISIPFLQ